MDKKVSIHPTEYVECIGFTAYAYLANKIAKRDLMKGSERSFGEFLEHFIRGKLAEIAFKKYMQSEFQLSTLTDVDLPIWINGEYLPDIVAIKDEDNWKPTQYWIEIKAVTPKQRWMLIPTTSILGGKRAQPRPYCAYVECMVDLPKDHVARLIKFCPIISSRLNEEWEEKLTDLKEIEVTILGYALFEDINNILKLDKQAKEKMDGTFGRENYRFLEKRKSFKDVETGKYYGNFGRDNCVIRLNKLRNNWTQIKQLMLNNTPIAPDKTRNQTSFDQQMSNALTLLSKKTNDSWFTRKLETNVAQKKLTNYKK